MFQNFTTSYYLCFSHLSPYHRLLVSGQRQSPSLASLLLPCPSKPTFPEGVRRFSSNHITLSWIPISTKIKFLPSSTRSYLLCPLSTCLWLPTHPLHFLTHRIKTLVAFCPLNSLGFFPSQGLHTCFPSHLRVFTPAPLPIQGLHTCSPHKECTSHRELTPGSSHHSRHCSWKKVLPLVALPSPQSSTVPGLALTLCRLITIRNSSIFLVCFSSICPLECKNPEGRQLV